MKHALTQWEIYRWPALLIVVVAGGLLSALLGDGIWDSLSWLLLDIPLLVVAFCLLRPSSKRQSN